jgi:hypothetical protein
VNSISSEQRRYLAAKLCRIQRELAKLVEHFYEQQVEFDDDLQVLTSRAFDDVRELAAHVRGLESTQMIDEVA